LSHGRARGREPVIYVNKIRNYQNILHAQLGQKQAIHAD
jgi:membrane-bound lytic murein transglycosylase MltF